MTKILLSTLLLSTVALADNKGALPTKMPITDALRLNAAYANHKRVFDTKAAEARAEAAPFDAEIARICRLYKIDPAQLTVTVGVDSDTGEIQRVAPTPPALSMPLKTDEKPKTEEKSKK